MQESGSVLSNGREVCSVNLAFRRVKAIVLRSVLWGSCSISFPLTPFGSIGNKHQVVIGESLKRIPPALSLVVLVFEYLSMSGLAPSLTSLMAALADFYVIFSDIVVGVQLSIFFAIPIVHNSRLLSPRLLIGILISSCWTMDS